MTHRPDLHNVDDAAIDRCNEIAWALASRRSIDRREREALLAMRIASSTTLDHVIGAQRGGFA